MADAEIIQFPDYSDSPWDGDSAQSRRWVNKQGVANMQEQPEYDAMWVAYIGNPPRLEGEMWHEWAARTETERGVGSSALKIVQQIEEEKI